jgi:uroporphyrinogen decarboxylase
VEGRGGTDFHTIKAMMYQRPDLLHRLLEVNARAVTAYLNAQIEAGAQAIMIFDTWGGVLADGMYQQFSLAYMRRILGNLTPYRMETDEHGNQHAESVPTILFTKGGAPWLDALSRSGANAVGIDWTMNLAKARQRVGPTCVLQGNLDPMALLTSPAQVREQVVRALDSYGAANTGRGHVFNLGHGISQFTPPEHVSVLVETVHEHSRKLRQSPFA